MIFKLPLNEATEALDKWVGWARRCRIPAFVKLQRSIVKHRTAILASIEHGLSNGRIESINTRIRLITRIAFGFKSSDALIALASSASAATNQYSQAGLNPRKSQESPKRLTNPTGQGSIRVCAIKDVYSNWIGRLTSVEFEAINMALFKPHENYKPPNQPNRQQALTQPSRGRNHSHTPANVIF